MIENLPPFSIILAPAYLHPILRAEIMKQTSGCMGLQLLSPQTFLASYTQKQARDHVEVSFLYKQNIEKIISRLQTYGSIALTPSFLMECYDFVETMKFYHITIEELPSKTQAQQEIKMILTNIFPIQTAQDIWNEAILRITDCSNVYIYDAFYSLKDQKILDILTSKGANTISLPKPQQQKEFYHAINPRQEVEAIAQYIIQHDLDADDIVMTLASSTYKPLIEQIFKRYEIPYTLLQKTKTSIITQRFVNLIAYALSFDQEALLACMDAGIFQLEHLDEVREYIEIFSVDVFQPFDHLRNIQAKGHILDEVEILKLKELEETAESGRQELCDTLSLLKEDDVHTLINHLFDILQNSMKEASVEDVSVLSDIQEVVSSSWNYLNTKEDLAFLSPFIEQISISKSVREIQGVMIGDLKQIIPNRTHHFLVGATQKNYPAFPSESGIFDEIYLHDTPLPDMEIRYQFYIAQCEKQLQTNPHLIVSFPLGTYEGKGNEAALEIEEEMKCDPIAFPIVENYERITQTYSIQPETAKALFVKGHHIKGSISAIERYIHCPYSYFLRYGLSLREPMQHGFDNSYMGTMAHYVLETLVDEFGKQYTKAAMDKIEEIVDQEVESIAEVFPNNADLMEVIKHRFLVSFVQTLKRLDDFETHSAMHPYLQEYEFHEEFPIKDDISFALKGFIDRIDASGNFHCILDYKSSAKSLSVDDVFAALQLQLLTYSIVAKKQLHKDILGVYYVSLKNQNIPYIAGKMKRRPVGFVETEKDEYEENILKAHRLSGWTMRKDIDMLDDNGSHIIGVSMNKDGIVKARKYYSFETIYEWFISLYRTIGNRMLSGDIACSPDADACTYCTYYEICRFKGFSSERKPLVDIDDTLYWEGGVGDADME